MMKLAAATFALLIAAAWAGPLLAPIVIKKSLPSTPGDGGRHVQSICSQLVQAYEELHEVLGSKHTRCECSTNNWGSTYTVVCSTGEYCCPKDVCGAVESEFTVVFAGNMYTTEQDGCTQYTKGKSGKLCTHYEYAETGGLDQCRVELNGNACNSCSECDNAGTLSDEADFWTIQYDCSNVPGGEEHSVDCEEAQELLDLCVSPGTKSSSLLVLSATTSLLTTATVATVLF